MTYCMRYLGSEDKEINLGIIEAALKSFDTRYQVEIVDGEQGRLFLGKQQYADLTIHRRGNASAEAETQKLLPHVEAQAGEVAELVASLLKYAPFILVMDMVWEDRGPDETLEKLDPLIDWLLEQVPGLLQADDEGYYDAEGIVLELESSDQPAD